MAQNRVPAWIVISDSSPPLLRDAAAELAGRLGGAELRELFGTGPAYLADPRGVAELILELG
jgi:hypothetical protein